MSTKPKASIVILDFFKSKRVVQNVQSILAQKVNFPIEIVVVDNSANPENAKKLEPLKHLPNVKLFVNEQNVGYTRGMNQGVKRTKGEYVLVVNPDIIWEKEDCLQKMIDHMDANPNIGVMGPKQINDDGSITMSVRAFPKISLQIARRTSARNWPILKQMVAYDEMQHLDYNKTQSVDWLQSSFWVTRRSLWNQLGGLDEKYFLFMSDPDYCYKSWKAGFQVVYFTETNVRADGVRCSQGGIKDFFGKWIIRQHLKDSIKYRLKHIGRGNPRKKALKYI